MNTFTTAFKAAGEVRKLNYRKVTPRTEIGRRIDTLIESMGVSRAEIARQMEVPVVTFNTTLVKHHFRADAIPRLAEILGVSTHYLLTGDDGVLEQVTRGLTNFYDRIEQLINQPLPSRMRRPGTPQAAG
ncbi:MAG: bacteriophage CI repressor [Sulfitobacter sp.]|nr:bacteriophage CI repressor [Sulfitobacter sp.]